MSRSLHRLEEHEREPEVAAEEDDLEAEHDPAVSRRASLADLRRQDPVHQAAADGVATPALPLPHADRIQAAFGGHDLSRVQAHVDARSTAAMGAQAYASGNHVVFAREPDLHTAAHEAAHVVQQARGVSFYGGVGHAGDAHEKQADAVADRVVAGQSAADLLGTPTKDAAPATTGVVQHKKKDDVEDATKDQRDAQNEKARLGAYWAIQAQITLAASRMHAAADRIGEIINQTEFDEAGGEREAGELEGIYSDVESVMQSLLGHVQAGFADMPDYTRNQLGAELGKLDGAWFKFGNKAQRANGFLARHHRAPIASKNTSIHAAITKVYGVFGLTSQDITRDTAAPQGGPAAAEQTAIQNTLDALYEHLHAARMDAHGDLEAGHKQVEMASHRAKEAHELLRSSSDRKKAKKYGPALKKIKAEAEKLADSSPNLYMDLKKFGLLEEIDAMKKGR